MGKTLKRSVSILGQVVPAGTVLTEAQEELVTNPKAFEDAGDATGPDAHDARGFENLVRSEAESPLRSRPGDEAAEDQAAKGAKLARGGRVAPESAAKG